MSGYNLRSRKVESNFTNENIETQSQSPISSTNSNNDLVCELETLREHNKNLYSKYNNISRSKFRMKNIISEKNEQISQLENKVKELLENKNNFTESKDIAEDWISLE
jgi:hypothetical protein